MTTWEITLLLSGAATEEQVEAVAKVADIDVTTGSHRSEAFASIEAVDVLRAVAIADDVLMRHGLTAVGVDVDDAVTLGDIASRVGRTGESIRLWSEGRRGPGGFPRPIADTGKVRVYSWAEVVRWLPAAGLSVPAGSDLGLADAALRLRARAGEHLDEVRDLLHT